MRRFASAATTVLSSRRCDWEEQISQPFSASTLQRSSERLCGSPGSPKVRIFELQG